MGMLFIGTPAAASMAFAIAGATPSIGSSPMPFAPPGPCAYGCSSKYTRMGGRSVAPDNMFVQRVADGLGDAAFDLPCRQHRVNHAADFLQRDEVIDLRLAGDGVH